MKETRIQKYSKLREKIEQEIKNLKLKNENDAKLNYYRNALTKIDLDLFNEANKKVDQLFPNLKSLIQAGQKNKDDDVENKKTEIKKWIEAIEIISQNNNQNKKIEDYVPDSNNEQFIKNVVNSWRKQKKDEIKHFQNLIKSKQNVTDYQRTDKQLVHEVKVLQEVNEVNDQVERLNNNLRKIINVKKMQNKKWFWMILSLLVLSVVCLVIILIH